jgi:hypothetical protein
MSSAAPAPFTFSKARSCRPGPFEVSALRPVGGHVTE